MVCVRFQVYCGGNEAADLVGGPGGGDIQHGEGAAAVLQQHPLPRRHVGASRVHHHRQPKQQPAGQPARVRKTTPLFIGRYWFRFNSENHTTEVLNAKLRCK